jgi:excisionase family DNA binding protein
MPAGSSPPDPRRLSDEYLSPKEIAASLGVTRRTLRRWKSQGRIPAPARISSQCLRYKRSDIEKALASHQA